ncbi:hypothetical protein RM844_06805 [Streptomyces sp. DSM 44915]|uniref:Uncharacterized protein n=1 Tax=Streptomyces chisholmiae TaxID=3075540 RepID=A0ABU2JMN3_9ACTN|nr:hypothetical protein [Streptomyces sp. DSM 44915]MDT0266001.1 hypothetical protein [Streptomyces sp. DSM 44915]
MPHETADLLLAAGRAVGLRCYLGPLPLDADALLRGERESDLPRLPDGASEYHFEARTVGLIGTFFTLRLGPEGAPILVTGDGGHHPADPDGLRAVADHVNGFAGNSVLGPRTYVWLQGHSGQARAADEAHQARLRVAMARAGWPVAPAPPTGPTTRTAGRRWRWPWSRG